MNRALSVQHFFPSLVTFLFLLCAAASLAAWAPPSAQAPNGNTPAPINSSTTPQSKGGTVIPKGSLLDINGVLSANFLFSWNDATFNGDLTVGSLAGEGVRPVCVGDDHRLYICGPVCGNNIIETGEQCDDGNTASGDGCSSQCIVEDSGVEVGGSCGYTMKAQYAFYRHAKFTLYEGTDPATWTPYPSPRDIKIDYMYWVYDINTLQPEGPIGPDYVNFSSGPATQTFEISQVDKELKNLNITSLTPAVINGKAICPAHF
jgi:cysteine-rich repeat protein